MASVSDTTPKAPPIKYTAHLGTRWQKEKAAAGFGAFEFPEDPKYIGQWIIGECIGKGASGRVRIAKHRYTGQLAAIKILPFQPLVNSDVSLATHLAKSEKQRLSIDREIVMMKLMNHPNILRIYDVFEGENELYLVLEYVEGGELFDFLVNRGRLPPLEALAFFKQIVYGLNYAHTFSIIHRDLKPENILISSLNPPLIKVADWGMAAFAPHALQLETSCGSPHYASPEIVNGVKYKGNATDIWSCGVILYALLTGRLPFDDKNVRTLLAKVKTGRYELPAYIDPMAKDLLTRMLVVDVNQRITIPEIMDHPWFNKSTPGIFHVPAPSVAELAQPLMSTAHIDEELLDSLVVMWGKHADSEVIKTDLLSPRGQGTLAKAFYFLLYQYREQTLQDNGTISDIDQSHLHTAGKVVARQYRSPSQWKSSRLETEIPTRHARLHTRRDAPSSPSRKPSTMGPSLPTLVSRSRTPSPVGPRPPRPRPVLSPAIPTRHKSMTTKPAVTKPPNAHADRARACSSTATMLSPCVAAQHAQSYYAHNPLIYQPMYIPGTPPMGAGATHSTWFRVSHPSHLTGPVLSPGIIRVPVSSPVTGIAGAYHPRSTPASPRLEGRDLKMGIKQTTNISNRVDVLVTHVNVMNGQESWSPSQDMQPSFEQSRDRQVPPVRYTTASTTTEDARCPGRGQENKENSDRCEGMYAYQEHDPMQISSDLFAKPRRGRRAGRELRNSLHSIAFLKRDSMKDKEIKTKAPPLDLHTTTLSTARSVITSPIQLTTPTMSSMISSPVGELKGWFSNLFNWKAHTYVLWSATNLIATRAEIIRILEQFGVTLEDRDGGHVHHGGATFRCRMNDVVDSNNGVLIQKHVRFRVEFTLGSLQGGGLLLPPLGTGTGAGIDTGAAASPTSPTLAATRYALSKEARPGYTCAIVLVQEKGSVPTFRTLCRWLREEWSLDVLNSPPTPTREHWRFFEQQQRYAML
ncbi:hypothetical protein BU15DRAFT_46245 [Melanogaster broomeanus]|nr:hypothetical protein BU15DRAFT_46245 [Melanogaster broomeanus]